MISKHLLCGAAATLLYAAPSLAQSDASLQRLYEQASETSGLVVQYGADANAVSYFYGPMSSGGYGRRRGASANSPEQRERMLTLDNEYLQKLSKLDFDDMSIYGQVDYVLLKRKV